MISDRDLPAPRTGRALVASILGTLVLAGATAASVGCEEQVFTKSMTLGGKNVSAETLEAGREVVHALLPSVSWRQGRRARSRRRSVFGPRRATSRKANSSSRPSRAARSPTTTTSGASSKRACTAPRCSPWDVPDEDFENIIQYIKTFSPKWEKEKPGAPIVAPPDPWAGQEPAAIQRGKELYHVTTQCSGCHPNYATKEDIAAMTLRLKKFAVTELSRRHVRLGFERERVSHHASPETSRPDAEARGQAQGAKHEEGEKRDKKAERAKQASRREVLRREHPAARLHALPVRSGDALDRSVPHHCRGRRRHRDALVESDRPVHRSDDGRALGRREGHLGARALREIADRLREKAAAAFTTSSAPAGVDASSPPPAPGDERRSGDERCSRDFGEACQST